jgi:hypothetical protein
VGLLQ